MHKDELNVFYNNGEGGYIFISHSHLDFEKVRIVRNTLEENGYEPLCFYLKCLNDDDEVEGLIQREIDSRDIFLYLESPNSKKSRWVNKEREYINKCDNKTIFKINLTREQDLIEATLEMLRKTRVFISYSFKDVELYEAIKKRLIDKDLRVFDTSKLLNTDEYFFEIPGLIRKASQSGCFLLLLTENALNSREIAAEALLALKSDASIAVIKYGGVSINNSEMDYYLKTIECLEINDINDEEQLNAVVQFVKGKLRNK